MKCIVYKIKPCYNKYIKNMRLRGENKMSQSKLAVLRSQWQRLQALKSKTVYGHLVLR